METSIRQKIGIALSLAGGALLLGLKWMGPPVIIIGVFLVIVGLVLALKSDAQGNESKWVHDNTHADDD